MKESTCLSVWHRMAEVFSVAQDTEDGLLLCSCVVVYAAETVRKQLRVEGMAEVRSISFGRKAVACKCQATGYGLTDTNAISYHCTCPFDLRNRNLATRRSQALLPDPSPVRLRESLDTSPFCPSRFCDSKPHPNTGQHRCPLQSLREP